MGKFILLETDDKQNISSYADMNWNTTNWKIIYSQLNDSVDREKLVDGFIDSFLTTKNVPAIKFRSSLKNLLADGAPESLDKYNPFMLWINSYNLKVKDIGAIDDEDFNSLINLYDQQVLLDEDLTGSSNLGTKSIIFNGDLFKQSENNLNYLVRIFYWLDQHNNANKVFGHLNSMDKRQQNQFCNELETHPNSLNDIKTPGDIKYFFTFKSGKYSSMGQLKNAFSIQNSLKYLDNRVRYKGNKEEEKEYTKEEKETLNRIVKNLSNPKQFRYTEQQVKSILDMLLKSDQVNLGMDFDDLQKVVYNSLLKNFGHGK